MKRAILLMVALCLMVSGSAVAENGNGMKGWALVSGYAGYTIGMGDAFKDWEAFGVKYSQDAGISFGGAFHYGVTDMILIGGELGFQSYKAEATVEGVSASDTEIKMNIIGSGLYALSWTENEQAFFIAFGVGYYGGWEEVGFNAGVLYSKMLGSGYPVFIMPRFHYVMSDPAATMLQVVVGVSFPVAGYVKP